MKLVLKQAGKYGKDAFITMGLTAGEVLLEILMPFITAIIIDDGLQASDLSVVVRYGILMVAMASYRWASAPWPAVSPPSRPPASRPTCARPYTITYRPFPSPTSTSSPSPALSPA